MHKNKIFAFSVAMFFVMISIMGSSPMPLFYSTDGGGGTANRLAPLHPTDSTALSFELGEAWWPHDDTDLLRATDGDQLWTEAEYSGSYYHIWPVMTYRTTESWYNPQAVNSLNVRLTNFITVGGIPGDTFSIGCWLWDYDSNRFELVSSLSGLTMTTYSVYYVSVTSSSLAEDYTRFVYSGGKYYSECKVRWTWGHQDSNSGMTWILKIDGSYAFINI